MKEMKIERKEKFVQICQIQGYENIKDQYWISNADEDKVMNRNSGKQLKIGLNDYGYKIVSLRTKDRKYRTCYLHVLKTKAFIYSPNPLGANVVRHLNDCKTDNRLINLAWGSQSDNMKDCIRNRNFNYESSVKNGVKNGVKNFAKNGAKNSARGGAITAKKLSKPVRCVEIGIIYPSTREASRQTKIPLSSISDCCNGRRKTAGGFHFEFINRGDE